MKMRSEEPREGRPTLSCRHVKGRPGVVVSLLHVHGGQSEPGGQGGWDGGAGISNATHHTTSVLIWENRITAGLGSYLLSADTSPV